MPAPTQDEFYDRLYKEFGPQWVDEHADELYRQHYDDAVREFTTERLQSYYVMHPDLAQPAFRALAYAPRLRLHTLKQLWFSPLRRWNLQSNWSSCNQLFSGLSIPRHWRR